MAAIRDLDEDDRVACRWVLRRGGLEAALRKAAKLKKQSATAQLVATERARKAGRKSAEARRDGAS